MKKRRNMVTIGKLVVTGLFIWLAYSFMTRHSDLFLLGAVLLAIVFVGLTWLDSRIVEKINELEALIFCNRTEIDSLNHNFSSLDRGERYIDANHEYSHDLDIFGDNSLFQSINRASTPGGADLLAEWLRTPCQDKSEIKARQEAAAELSRKQEWALLFRATGKVHPVTEADAKEITRWAGEPLFFKHPRRSKVCVRISNGLAAACVFAAFFGLFSGWYVGAVFLIQLLIAGFYSRSLGDVQQRLGHFMSAFGNYYFLALKIKDEQFESSRLNDLYNRLFNGTNSIRAFAALKKIAESFDQRNNLLVNIFFNGIYLRDIRLLLTLDQWKKSYAGSMLEWTTIINELDAYVGMANYRFNHPEYVTPCISDEYVVKTSGAGHPLLRKESRICNDFEMEHIHQLYLITGANMAGKSTFLRTIGINLVLALSGNVVCANCFSCKPIRIFSSMRTSDNLSEGTSYFHAELLRLQKLVRLAEHDEVFIILDEMLKGTNSQDKLNGSLRFLTRLLSLPVAGLIATHDLGLSTLAEKYPDKFFNACFEIEHVNGDIQYDYTLKKGVCKNMNASFLLEQMGLI